MVLYLLFLPKLFMQFIHPVRYRLSRASCHTKTTCCTLLFIDYRVEESIEENSIVKTRLFARVAYDAMVGHTRFYRNRENGIQPLRRLPMLQRQYIRFTGYGTCFAECTPILLKTQRRYPILTDQYNLFITRSDTVLVFTRGALTLKKRFGRSVWRPQQQGRFPIY